MPWLSFEYKQAEVLSGSLGLVNYIDHPELLESPEIEIIEVWKIIKDIN